MIQFAIERVVTPDQLYCREPRFRECCVDFVRKSDPGGLNGYDADDIQRIAYATVGHPTDATWLGLHDGVLLAFCIVCVGPGIHLGTFEGHVVALYVDWTGELGMHRKIRDAVEAWGRAFGLRRVVGGTQRPSEAWSRMGYRKVAELYSLEIGG